MSVGTQPLTPTAGSLLLCGGHGVGKGWVRVVWAQGWQHGTGGDTLQMVGQIWRQMVTWDLTDLLQQHEQMLPPLHRPSGHKEAVGTKSHCGQGGCSGESGLLLLGQKLPYYNAKPRTLQTCMFRDGHWEPMKPQCSGFSVTFLPQAICACSFQQNASLCGFAADSSPQILTKWCSEPEELVASRYRRARQAGTKISKQDRYQRNQTACR